MSLCFRFHKITKLHNTDIKYVCAHVYECVCQLKDHKGAQKEGGPCWQHHKKLTKSPASLMNGTLPILKIYASVK